MLLIYCCKSIVKPPAFNNPHPLFSGARNLLGGGGKVWGKGRGRGRWKERDLATMSREFECECVGSWRDNTKISSLRATSRARGGGGGLGKPGGEAARARSEFAAIS